MTVIPGRGSGGPRAVYLFNGKWSEYLNSLFASGDGRKDGEASPYVAYAARVCCALIEMQSGRGLMPAAGPACETVCLSAHPCVSSPLTLFPLSLQT